MFITNEMHDQRLKNKNAANEYCITYSNYHRHLENQKAANNPSFHTVFTLLSAGWKKVLDLFN